MNAHTAQIEVGARSKTGYVRSENQDRMSGTCVPLGRLYIVADGMGGHKAGATAAELTVQGLQQRLANVGTRLPVVDAIRTAFSKTNETIYQQGHSGDPATAGMGSTAVLLLLTGPHAYVAHVGDSRAYLYRQGQLRRLTTDHTRVQKMITAGMITEQEARVHTDAGVLERAMGNKPDVEVDIHDTLLLTSGDGILLCSDGLSGYVADHEIHAVLRGASATQEIPDQLIQLALQKGGNDNITVQFIQYGRQRQTHASKKKWGSKLWPVKIRRQFVRLLLLVFFVSFGALAFSSLDRSPTVRLFLATLGIDTLSQREQTLHEKLDGKEKAPKDTKGNVEQAKKELEKAKGQTGNTTKNDDGNERALVPETAPEEYFTFSFP